LTPEKAGLIPKSVASRRAANRRRRRMSAMKLVRWDPFDELVTMSRGLGRSFDRADAGWVPAVDIFERGDTLVFRAEIPGVARENMDVRVENGVLTIEGERKRDVEPRDDNAFRRERSYGAFTRSFSLPTTVDATKVEAGYKDGILEVIVPKVETAKPKKVEIKAA
jgi:HSP20 family protein